MAVKGVIITSEILLFQFEKKLVFQISLCISIMIKQIDPAINLFVFKMRCCSAFWIN